MTPTPSDPGPIRLGLACDYVEEQWPSMDLVGDMILAHLANDLGDQVHATRIRPPFQHRLTRWPGAKQRGVARNVDRLLNRFWDYPRALAREVGSGRFDLFHVADHSYGQLVHVLPPDRAVISCHDLDAFRCLLEPEREPRPLWFRLMARRILGGVQRAAAVLCISAATADGLRRHGLVPDARLHVVHLAVSPEFTVTPDPSADRDVERWLGATRPDAPPDLLYVGSNIPRKRIDVLLDVFAEVRRSIPGARLLKAGGGLTTEQAQQAERLGIADAIVFLPFLDRTALAAVYRRAALVLLPSAAEGFGFPVVEALACGAPFLASDLAVLREVGGDEAPVFRPVGDVVAWTRAAIDLLDERTHRPEAHQARRAAGLAQARRFSWSEHVRRLLDIYRDVLDRAETAPGRAVQATP